MLPKQLILTYDSYGGEVSKVISSFNLDLSCNICQATNIKIFKQQSVLVSVILAIPSSACDTLHQ